jgi:intracellular sulfur oxidation DsrE/DsrF family protein
MTNSRDSREVTRRNFLSDLAIGGTGVAALSMLMSDESRAEGVAPFPSPAPGAAEWDLSWIDRLTGKYRVAFDAPEVADGMAFTNASVFMMGFKEVYNASDADMQAVIVMRHHGVVLAFNDAMWEKYGLGVESKVENGEKKNPWTSDMESLRKRGATLLACNLAANRVARETARRLNLDAEAVRKDLFANLVPGVVLQPSGVFATIRAQEAGCAFMKSG